MEWNEFRASQKGSGKSMKELSHEYKSKSRSRSSSSDYTFYKKKPKSSSSDYTFYKKKPKYSFSKSFRGSIGSPADYILSQAFGGYDYLTIMPIDQIYEIAKNLDYYSLLNLCGINTRMKHLCATDQRFMNLLKKKGTFELYSLSSDSDADYYTESSSEESQPVRSSSSGEYEKIPRRHFGEIIDVKRQEKKTIVDLTLQSDKENIRTYLLNKLPIKPQDMRIRRKKIRLQMMYDYRITLIYNRLSTSEKQSLKTAFKNIGKSSIRDVFTKL